MKLNIIRQSKKLSGLVFLVIMILGNQTLNAADKAEQAVLMYEAGTGHEDMTLAILRPRGIDLAPEQGKYLDILQGALISDFQKFSAIKLFDSKNMEDIITQQNLSVSGLFSDKEYLSIGKLLNAKFILAGTLTKINNTQFDLYLSLTNVETGEPIAISKRNIKLREIINSSASRAVVSDILPDLGVKFTPEGERELKTVLTAEETEAQNALALSYEASRKGNLIDALIYSYAASDADKDSAAAKKQASDIFRKMGGSGAAIKEDIKRQEYWKNNLKAFEDFYRDHPPFELVYTPVNIEKGITDYDRGITSFEFYAGLRHKSVTIMQKVLNDILKELKQTDYKKNRWGFDNWPQISAVSTKSNQIYTDIFNNYVTFNITAALLDDNDEIVASLIFPLYGQLMLSGGNTINVFSTQERRMVLTIPNDILMETDHIYFQVIGINDYDTDMANVNAYLRNSTAAKMPAKSRISIPAEKQLIPELPEEMEKRLAAQQKENAKQEERETRQNAKNSNYMDRQKEKAVQNREKKQDRDARRTAREEVWNTKDLKGRRNLFASVLYNHVRGNDWKNALAIEGGLGFGYKNFSLDGRLVYPINHIVERYQGTGDLIFGFGAVLGYSYVWNNFIGSLEGGATWYRDSGTNSFAFVPTVEGKFDIVPWKPGIGFRFAYKLEFGSPDKSGLHNILFNNANAFGGDKVRMIGSPTAGLVIWY